MSKITQTLGEYVNNVLDTNKDGRTDIKDLLNLFPSNAVAIAVLFVDLLVAAAEYRVWDVGYQITGDPLKAIGFVLVSAVPFYLGQIFWLYPVANGIQKAVAVLMVVASLYTSWVFGTADLSMSYDVTALIGIVVNLTAGYIVLILGYILSDDGIKANRMKKQAEGAAKQEKEYQQITRSILRELAETQRLQKETEQEFGDSALVQSQLERIRGKKKDNKPEPRPYQVPVVANASETVEPPKIVERQNPTQGGS